MKYEYQYLHVQHFNADGGFKMSLHAVMLHSVLMNAVSGMP